MCWILFWRDLAVGANHRPCSTIDLFLALFFLASMQRNQFHTAMLTQKASKFKLLRLQLWISKKQWSTDMQKSFLFVSVVESFYRAINSSIISSLLIMLRFILHSLSLKSFFLLNHIVDIHTKACFINFFVFVYPTTRFFISFTYNAIESKKRSLFFEQLMRLFLFFRFYLTLLLEIPVVSK